MLRDTMNRAAELAAELEAIRRTRSRLSQVPDNGMVLQVSGGEELDVPPSVREKMLDLLEDAAIDNTRRALTEALEHTDKKE